MSDDPNSAPSVRERFEAVALPLLNTMHSVALRLTRSQEDAADLVQETLLRAYRSFERFTPGTNARAWLLTILYSIFVNAYRKGRREPEVVSLEERESRFERILDIPDWEAYTSLLRKADRAWKGSEVESALGRLPEPFRLAVLLVDVQGLSYEEAASVVECPVGTLRSRLFRARKVLAVELLEYAQSLGYVRS